MTPRFDTNDRRRFRIAALALFVGVLVAGRAADAQLTGEPVPLLDFLDSAVNSYALTYLSGAGGTVAVSKGGCVIYQRGFGGLPENSPMRMASLEKKFVSRIVRDLALEGRLALSDYAIDLDQPWYWLTAEGRWRGPGILPNPDPLGAPAGRWWNRVTIQDLIEHKAGWKEGVSGNLHEQAREIAGFFGVPSPPQPDHYLRFALRRDLDLEPGSEEHYWNFGYAILARVIRHVTGASVADNIRARYLNGGNWVPATDVYLGRSLPPDRGPREPGYRGVGHPLVRSVFDLSQTSHLDYTGYVDRPDGGWHHEGTEGAGNLVANAVALLRFAERRLWDPTLEDDDYQAGKAWAGGATGTTAMVKAAYSEDEELNDVFIAVQENATGRGNDAGILVGTIESILRYRLRYGINWPTRCVDGFWVEFGRASSVHGSYDRPFGSMENLLAQTTDNSKVQLHPNTSTTWKGTITQRMLITAPLGPAKIGVQ